MRKKLFSILALLLTVCGAWAQSNTEDTYTVVGNNTAIFGGDYAWAILDANLMAKGDDGKYRKEYNVNDAYNTVQLKVVKNESEWFGENDNNVEFNLTDAGTFTVVFDPETNGVSVTGEIVEEITQLDIDNVYAVGNGEGNWLNGAAWDPAYAANEMTEVADNVWQITFNDVPDGFERQVKFAINGAWTHNFGWPQNPEGDYELGEWFAAGYNGDNITFDTDDICTVTLTLDLNDFDINTKEGAKFKINIVYPTDPTDPTDISFATVTGINASYDWTGNEIHPVPVVTLDGNVLSSTTDYDVTYSDGCTNVGSYNVTITGKNDYTGTIEKSFNINDVFYLVGSMNNWEINQNYKLVKNKAAETEEYFIKIVQFASDDEFKVASPGRKTEWDGATWYPDGMDNNYVISNAGIYDIYFRPNGNGGSDWHEGYIYAAESVGGFDVALAPTGYGTFYCEDYEATLPSGVVAYIVTDATPTYEVIADGDGETKTIPAGTAVLLYSASKPSNVTLSLDLTGSTTDDRTFTNLLDGSDVETQTDTDAAKYYKLTYGNDNTTFGWYWGAANGAAFTSPAHKAWLALPASAGARAFFNLPGEENTTGIATIENKQQKADNVWYDLNGRRINAPKTKGIYVKDGRKLVIK